ncbi:hypothetical protein FS749_013021 [Ceratobasidium sp. UAMH 11750]|nr:hypothetical protein FS749_013021 [Ceratobasidium sp. UAMH 11750]
MPKVAKASRSSTRSSPIPARGGSSPVSDTDYDLSPDAARLPTALEPAHKLYLNQFIEGFRSHIGKRGARKENARIWTHDHVINKFLTEFYPNLDLTDDDKQWFRESKVGEQIYNFLGNHSKRRSRARAPRVHIKSKCFAHDSWWKAEPDEHRAAVDALIDKAYPDLAITDTKLSFGQLRAFTSKAFKQLPPDQQQRWKQVAQDELAAERAAAKLTDAPARERYICGLVKTLQDIVVEAEQKADVRLAIQVLADKGGNRFKLTSLVSDNLGDFSRSSALGLLLNALKTHVEHSEGGEVEGDAPLPDVMIDWANDGRPLLPEVTGMDVHKIRPLYRTFIKKKWAQQGGVGKVPWEDIGRALHEWIDPERLPPGAVWKDPGSMSLANLLLLVDWILQGQSGALGDASILQFRQVIAGTTAIDASESQESGREFVKLKGHDTYILKFDNYVTKCHAVRGIAGMEYSKSSLAYTHFRQTGKLQLDKPIISPAPPEEWMGLPYGADVPRSVFYGAELETILSLAPLLPSEHRERVENLVQLSNELQSHLPASNERAVWDCPVAPPKIIPSTPTRTPPQPFFAPIWGPECFYWAAKAPEETFAHYENWQDAALKSGVLIHRPSGTLFGDDTGYVWIIRSLLLIFFNFLGVKYNIQFPGAIPANFDLTRLPLNEWTRLLGWMDSWAQALRDSIAILQETSEARSLGLPSASYADAEPDEPVTTEPVMGSAPLKRPKPKPKKGPKGGESDEGEWEGGDDESDDDDDETDFEKLDKQPGESDEDEEHEDNYPGAEADGSFNDGFAGLDDHRLHASSSRDTATSAVPKSAETPANNSEIAVSTPKSPSSVTRPVATWKLRAHAFGPFRTFDEKKFTAPKTLVAALAALDDADRRWASDARELNLLADIYLSPHDINSEELAAAQGTVAPLFTEYIIHRRAAWEQASSLSQSLFQIAGRVLAIFSEAFKVYAVVQNYMSFVEMKVEHDGIDDSEIDRLKMCLERSSMSLVVARWTYIELQAFEKMATDHLNQQKGDWLSVLPTGLTELHQIAQAQVKWADAFSELKAQLLAKRKVLWTRAAGSAPFKPEHLTSGMKYPFGNPIADEEPVGLRDALARVAEELARPASSVALTSEAMDMESMTNNLGTTNNDAIMTDASSSIPVRQQDPTIAAPETAPVPPSATSPPSAPIASPEFSSGATTAEDARQESCAPPAQSPPAGAPPLSIAPPSSVAPASSVVSAPPIASPPSVTSDAPTGPTLPDSPIAPPTSSPAEHAAEKPSARKRPAPKLNGPDTSAKRVSVRQAALQAAAQVPNQNDAPARGTRAGTKQAEKGKGKEQEKEVAAGKHAPRKLKGRR